MASAVSGAVVMTAASCYYYLAWRKLRDEKARLTETVRKLTVLNASCENRLDTARETEAQLVSEARLLAGELNTRLKMSSSELNAIVEDPLLATRTMERTFVPIIDIIDETESLADHTVAERWQLAAAAVTKTLRRHDPSEAAMIMPARMPSAPKTQVIGVCGMSCSGKSTVTSTLRASAAERGVYVPVLCLDDSYHEWMFNEPPSRGQRTDYVVPGAGSGRRWKNWESPACVDYERFRTKLQATLRIFYGLAPFVIVEGFLLLEDEKTAALCDHVLYLQIEKESAWQRRLQRAMRMAEGEADASGQDNYEQLHVYAVDEDAGAVRADAAAHVAALTAAGVSVFPSAGAAAARTAADLSTAAGGYEWLRLYFDEVVWTEAEKVRGHVDAQARARPCSVRSIDGNRSAADVLQETKRFMQEVARLA